MLFLPSPSESRARIISAAAVLSAALVFAGCSNSDNSSQTTRAQTSSPSVEASNITHVPEQSQSAVMNFPTGDSRTSVLRVEQVSPQEIRAGRDYNYQVRISNLTDKPLQNVVLTGTRPEGFKAITNADGSPSTQPATDAGLSYSVGNLAPHETRSFTVMGTASGQGIVRQTYHVSYDQQMATAINVTAPAVAITKQGPRDADLCQAVDWTYAVKNTGSGVARNVTLRDTLPEGLITGDGQKMVSASLGDIPGGETRSVVAHLKAARAGQFASMASVTSDAGEAKSETITTAFHQPKLDVAIKGPDQEYLGKQVTYQVTVTNTGDAAARQAAIHFDASNNAKLVNVIDPAGAPLPAANAGAGQSLGDIAPAQTRVFNVSFVPNEAADLKVTAVASAQCADQVAKPTVTRIIAVPALLLEANDVVDPVHVGDNVVYKIRVTNQGNGPDTNIKVVATLPDEEQFVSATGVTAAAADGKTVTFAPVQSLNPKDAANWVLTVKATKAADVRFKVTATSDAIKEPAEKIEPTKLY